MEQNKQKITLIHPSRGRAEKAKQTYDYWIKNSSGNHIIEHILSCDVNDPERVKYHELFEGTSLIITSDNTCVVQAANNAAKLAEGDILIYLSDDFICPQKWDEEIVKKIGHIEKAMLKVNDLLQPINNAVLTIPIMTAGVYKELGYFFYHEYLSQWCDVDLYWVTKKYLIEAPELVFEHQHHSKGICQNDDTYRRSEVNWKQGLEVYNKRAVEFGWTLKTR